MAREVLRPPIEPLSEQARQRIEDAVINRLRWQEPQPAPSRLPRMALLLAAVSLGIGALAVVSATGLFTPESQEPVAVHQPRSAGNVVTGVAPSRALQEPAVTVPAGEPAEEQSRDLSVITTRSEPVTHELGGSELIVAARSRVRYGGTDADGWLVVVETGSVECEVAPRQGRPDFVVRAGTAEVRVVGTRFEVAYRGGQASVSVSQGKVLVFDSGQQTMLLAGQKWPETELEQTAADVGEADVAPRRGGSSATAREDYELAESLESAEPARALSIYRRLSNSRGAWAANALYAEARLLKEGGRDTEAKKLLSRYLKLYPRGPNSADARRLLGR